MVDNIDEARTPFTYALRKGLLGSMNMPPPLATPRDRTVLALYLDDYFGNGVDEVAKHEQLLNQLNKDYICQLLATPTSTFPPTDPKYFLPPGSKLKETADKALHDLFNRLFTPKESPTKRKDKSRQQDKKYDKVWTGFFVDYYARPTAAPVDPLVFEWPVHSAGWVFLMLRSNAIKAAQASTIFAAARFAHKIGKRIAVVSNFFERERKAVSKFFDSVPLPNEKVTDEMEERIKDAVAISESRFDSTIVDVKPKGKAKTASVAELPHTNGLGTYDTPPRWGDKKPASVALTLLCEAIFDDDKNKGRIDPVAFLADRFPRARFVDLFGAAPSSVGALVLPPVPIGATKTYMAERLLATCQQLFAKEGDDSTTAMKRAFFHALSAFLLCGKFYPPMEQSAAGSEEELRSFPCLEFFALSPVSAEQLVDRTELREATSLVASEMLLLRAALFKLRVLRSRPEPDAMDDDDDYAAAPTDSNLLWFQWATSKGGNKAVFKSLFQWKAQSKIPVAAELVTAVRPLEEDEDIDSDSGDDSDEQQQQQQHVFVKIKKEPSHY